MELNDRKKLQHYRNISCHFEYKDGHVQEIYLNANKTH